MFSSDLHGHLRAYGRYTDKQVHTHTSYNKNNPWKRSFPSLLHSSDLRQGMGVATCIFNNQPGESLSWYLESTYWEILVQQKMSNEFQKKTWVCKLYITLIKYRGGVRKRKDLVRPHLLVSTTSQDNCGLGTKLSKTSNVGHEGGGRRGEKKKIQMETRWLCDKQNWPEVKGYDSNVGRKGP